MEDVGLLILNENIDVPYTQQEDKGVLEMLDFDLDQKELLREAADLIDINGKCEHQYYEPNISTKGIVFYTYCIEGALLQAYLNNHNSRMSLERAYRDNTGMYQTITPISKKINMFLTDTNYTVYSLSDKHEKEIIVDVLKALADNNDEKVLEIIRK